MLKRKQPDTGLFSSTTSHKINKLKLTLRINYQESNILQQIIMYVTQGACQLPITFYDNFTTN